MLRRAPRVLTLTIATPSVMVAVSNGYIIVIGWKWVNSVGAYLMASGAASVAVKHYDLVSR